MKFWPLSFSFKKKSSSQDGTQLIISDLNSRIAALNDVVHQYWLSKEKQNRDNLITLGAILFKYGNKIVLDKNFLEMVSKNANLSIRTTPNDQEVILELVETEDK